MGKQKQHKVSPKLMDEITGVLQTVRLDARMALLDDWDRSDEGFEYQIEIIDRVLTKLSRYDDEQA